MEPEIVHQSGKYLIGKNLRMSLANDQTALLFRSFMPIRNAIQNRLSSDIFEVIIYDSDLEFKDFNPSTVFEKWAAVEVTEFGELPEGMKNLVLQAGLYAVFLHRGSSFEFLNTYNYIFKKWLPESSYILDQRAHFNVLGEKYKNNDPESEEEIWIPVKLRK